VVAAGGDGAQGRREEAPRGAEEGAWRRLPEDAHPDPEAAGDERPRREGGHPVVSPKVEYSLTPLVRSVQPLLEAICQWSERRLPEVEWRACARARTPSIAGRSRRRGDLLGRRKVAEGPADGRRAEDRGGDRPVQRGLLGEGRGGAAGAGEEVPKEYLAHLSLLEWEHVTLIGVYRWDLDDSPASRPGAPNGFTSRSANRGNREASPNRWTITRVALQSGRAPNTQGAPSLSGGEDFAPVPVASGCFPHDLLGRTTHHAEPAVFPLLEFPPEVGMSFTRQ
jgi:hypothetical protein